MSRKKFIPSETKKDLTSLLDAPTRDDQAITLPISALIIKQNPRTNLGDLEDLKNSIADMGLLNPLLVVKTASGWELLGGHRRLECAKQLGIADIPCRVVTTNEPEVVKLIDNVLHEALSPGDEIAAVAQLAKVFGGNQLELAKALGKSKTYISRCLKAAKLPTLSCAGATLSKSALFELADAFDPGAVLTASLDATKGAIRQARADTEKSGRQPSGPIPGGRAVSQAVHFRERTDGKGFSFRVNFDNEKTPPETRADIIQRLEDILLRLRAC